MLPGWCARHKAPSKAHSKKAFAAFVTTNGNDRSLTTSPDPTTARPLTKPASVTGSIRRHWTALLCLEN